MTRVVQREVRRIGWSPIVAIGGLAIACGGEAANAPKNAAPRGRGGSDTGGASSGTRSGSAAGGSAQPGAPIALNLTFDPIAGCRDFSAPGCGSCCRENVDLDGAASCTRETHTVDTISTGSLSGACPSDCPPCARCPLDAERFLLSLPGAPVLSCPCDGLTPGIDPCFAPSSCECSCIGLKDELLACPQLAGEACSGGDGCGVMLVLDNVPYQVGDQLRPQWVNLRSEPVYLQGSDAFGLERFSADGAGVTIPLPVSANPRDAALSIPPHSSMAAPAITITASMGAGLFGLTASYRIGCTAGLPIATAACTSGPYEARAGFSIRSIQ